MKAKKAVKKEIGEFRKFISRGAVLDMAIGVIKLDSGSFF